MRAAGLLLVLLFAACASGPRPIAEARLRALGTRAYVAPFDEVLNATVLTLERQGYLVTQADRQTGSVQATLPSGRGYSIDLTQREGEILVVALPIPWQPQWQLSGPSGEEQRWNELEKNTRALLRAWRTHPEWTLEAGRNLLTTLRFRVSLPREWEHVDKAVDRRQVVVQRRAPGAPGLNPTLIFSVVPRLPKHDLRRSLEDAAERAFEARGQVVVPERPARKFGRLGAWGTAQVLLGGQPQGLAWHQWDARTPEWTVQVTAVCGTLDTADACEREWLELVETLDDRGFDHPR